MGGGGSPGRQASACLAPLLLLLTHHNLLVNDSESDGVARVLVEVGGREYRRVAVDLRETSNIQLT